MNPCLNCRSDVGDENPPAPQHCGKCPPWLCDECGQPCSAVALCSCWTSLDGMNLADLKALFASDCGDDCGPELSLDPEVS